MIPFLDLKKMNAPYETTFQERFLAFLNSGHYILGKGVEKFEESFAAYCGAKFCIGTGNGLDALNLIFRGYIELGQLKEGDKIIVAANTYIATILAIKHAGLTPVLVEPDEGTFNLDSSLVSEKITREVRGILVTHLYGQLADMKKLREISEENNLLLIADSAQAHGAEDENGNKAGSLADATGFSFYPSKNLGALGDAGAVTTNDEDLAEVVSKLRNYGTSSKYINEYVGYNSRLDELQALFLLEKLPFLDEENDQRRNIATRYFSEIKNEKIKLPFWNGSKNHVFHLFVVRVKNRKDFCEFLNSKNIGNLVHYPIPPHKQKALSEFSDLKFPITEKIHEEVVSIPLNPMMTKEEIGEVVSTLNSY
ncbi:MAG TPA: DegT/DnrJ/EryC1/StrS family aminotransferase [Salinimicrobium sp.]|nr:DegT/DnrJ/EryC1/StrS family aminotransferase [Salinimicrobium sp.]